VQCTHVPEVREGTSNEEWRGGADGGILLATVNFDKQRREENKEN
jgi:hypothetical protein